MSNSPTPRLVSTQRWALTLLVAGGVLNYIDRATLSVANKTIQGELGIPIDKMGLLLSAFLWAYAFSQLPIGALIDRFGPRRLLALGLLGWSGAQAAGGFMRSFGPFVAARFALGMGEAPLFPGGARVVRDWFAIEGRGFATGVCQAASSLGNFIAIPLLTFLMLTFNWRWMFIIVGAIGVLLAGVWYAIYRDPAEVTLTSEEIRYLNEGDENRSTRRPSFAEWRLLFAQRTTWGMVAGFFGNVFILWLYTGWLPFYLEHEKKMEVSKAGLVAAIPYFFGCVGGVLGGWLCDYLTHRGMTPIGARKLLVGSSLFGIAACTCGTALAPNNVATLTFISISLFLIYVVSSAAWATVPVAAPSQFTASLGSIQNFGGYLGGALAPTVTGILVQRTGSFTLPLLLAAGLVFTCACIYLALVKHTIKIEDRPLVQAVAGA